MNEQIETVEEIKGEELIIVKQLPVIEEQLMAIKERFSEEAETAMALACTADTLQIVKKKRAELTKIYNALEAKRKEAKKAILAPYDAFEKIYKECVTEIYTPCDKKLAVKIHDVEESLKEEKRAEAEAFYLEYCQSKQIDFVPFERMGLNITLNISKKAMREQITAFVDKVSDEVELIKVQEHPEEVFVEYKASLNVAQAITTVANRHKAIEKEKLIIEKNEEIKRERERSANTVLETSELLSPPKVETAEQPEVEKKYRVSFSVVGTMQQIKTLKEFLVNGEYEYEQQ